MIIKHWPEIAALITIAGSLTWIIKIAMIVATNGRIINTALVGNLYYLGLVLLLVGSTGFGLWLMRRRSILMHLIGVALSPIFFVVLFKILDDLIEAISVLPSYWPQEGSFLLSGIVWFLLGLWLRVSTRQVSRDYTPVASGKGLPE